MLKLNPAPGAQTTYEVIDQFFAAQLAANESEETLNSLRPKAEAAVQALIAERRLLPIERCKKKADKKKVTKKN